MNVEDPGDDDCIAKTVVKSDYDDLALTVSRREESSCYRYEGDAPRIIGRSRVKDERARVALVSDDPVKRMLQPVPPAAPSRRCTSLSL